ncbi:MAG: hypothetical protein RI967_977 [Planctomycetota bacterium]
MTTNRRGIERRGAPRSGRRGVRVDRAWWRIGGWARGGRAGDRAVDARTSPAPRPPTRDPRSPCVLSRALALAVLLWSGVAFAHASHGGGLEPRAAREREVDPTILRILEGRALEALVAEGVGGETMPTVASPVPLSAEEAVALLLLEPGGVSDAALQTVRAGARARGSWMPSTDDLRAMARTLVVEALVAPLGPEVRLAPATVESILRGVPPPPLHPAADRGVIEATRRLARLRSGGARVEEAVRRVRVPLQEACTVAVAWRDRCEAVFHALEGGCDGSVALAIARVARMRALSGRGWSLLREDDLAFVVVEPGGAEPTTAARRVERAREAKRSVGRSIEAGVSGSSTDPALARAVATIAPLLVDRVESITVSAGGRVEVATRTVGIDGATAAEWRGKAGLADDALPWAGRDPSPDSRRRRLRDAPFGVKPLGTFPMSGLGGPTARRARRIALAEGSARACDGAGAECAPCACAGAGSRGAAARRSLGRATVAPRGAAASCVRGSRAVRSHPPRHEALSVRSAIRRATLPPMSDASRHLRQMQLPGFGAEGQRRLTAARVFVAGCGALGTVVVEQLVRAGVGTVVVVDRDIVERSNLQRQTLFTERDAERAVPKAEAAKARLLAVDPGVTVRAVVDDLVGGNAARHAEDCDLLIDCLDNFETRYLLNDLAVSTGRALVYGGAVGFRGMAAMLCPITGVGRDGAVRWDAARATPCLRCLAPDPPAAGEVETCETAGVLAAAPGIVGSLEASFALQALAAGEPSAAASRIVRFDLARANFSDASLASARDPACPCCAGGAFAFLAQRAPVARVLCGRGAVEVPLGERSMGRFDEVASSLAALGPVACETHGATRRAVLRADAAAVLGCGGLSVLDAASGLLVLVEGVDDADRARAIVARSVGV